MFLSNLSFNKLSSVIFIIVFSLNVNAADQKETEAKAKTTNGEEEIKKATVIAPAVKESSNELEDELKSNWSSEAELGFVKTTGNTETESFNVKFAVDNKRVDWEHSLKIESARVSDETATTAERYFISGKSQYSLHTLSYLFFRLQYEDDRFSGYNYQASEIIGYGRHLIKTNELKFNAELGVGVRQNDFDDGTKTSEAVFVIASDLKWKISKSATLSEDLSIEIGEDRTINKLVSGLKTKINSSLSSKITYTIKHASEVPVGTDKTDTELAITLVYAFK